MEVYSNLFNIHTFIHSIIEVPKIFPKHNVVANLVVTCRLGFLPMRLPIFVFITT